MSSLADEVTTIAFESLAVDAHASFIVNASASEDTLEHAFTEHLRLSGIYWGVCALATMGNLRKTMDADKREEILSYVASCRCESGAYSGGAGHDGHVLYTLSAVQIYALFDAMDRIDRDSVVNYVKGLQLADGSFQGDEWGEVDTRFTYCALSTLRLLDRLHEVDVEAACAYINKCKNFDGGFGATPGGESHAGQVFTCVGALAIGNRLDYVDGDLLGWWLAERQVKIGGLNGRPEKLPDVCYSWWVLSALSILGKTHWIDRGALARFILRCQDETSGGISDRPDDEPDVYHTFFGIAGLSLMGHPAVVEPIDPVFALPNSVLKQLGIEPWSARKC